MSEKAMSEKAMSEKAMSESSMSELQGVGASPGLAVGPVVTVGTVDVTPVSYTHLTLPTNREV